MAGPEVQLVEETLAYAVVITQDCDLERHWEARDGERNSGLLSILVLPAYPVAELKGKVPTGKDIWKRISQNKDERYHCLESCKLGIGEMTDEVPSLGLDFRGIVGIPPDEMYERILVGQTDVCAVLESPYVEDLAARWTYYWQRVALPQPHLIE